MPRPLLTQTFAGGVQQESFLPYPTDLVKQFVLGSCLSQFSIESLLHFLNLIMERQELTFSSTLVGQEQITTSSALLQCLKYFSSRLEMSGLTVSKTGHTAGKSLGHHLASLLDNTQAEDIFYTNTVAAAAVDHSSDQHTTA